MVHSTFIIFSMIDRNEMIETDINYMSLEINSVVSNLSKYPSISLPWRALWDFCPSFMSNAVYWVMKEEIQQTN